MGAGKGEYTFDTTNLLLQIMANEIGSDLTAESCADQYAKVWTANNNVPPWSELVGECCERRLDYAISVISDAFFYDWIAASWMGMKKTTEQKFILDKEIQKFYFEEYVHAEKDWLILEKRGGWFFKM